MLDLLEKRVGLPEGATVVVDRGMSGPENIAELRRRNLHYLVAASQKERDLYLAEFEAERWIRRSDPTTIPPQSEPEKVVGAGQSSFGEQ